MPNPSDRLREARKRAGFRSAAAFAKAHDLPEVTYRAHENGIRGLDVETARRYARWLGESWQWILSGERPAPADRPRKASRIIPVVGYVGAGPFHPIDDSPGGQGIDEFELDDDDEIDPVIFVVRGDSGFPVYRDGERVRGSRRHGRDMAACMGKDCIVQLADGAVMLKLVHAGAKKGTVTLVSYNPSEPPLQDVKIDWCAPVRRVYRG